MKTPFFRRLFTTLALCASATLAFGQNPDNPGGGSGPNPIHDTPVLTQKIKDSTGADIFVNRHVPGELYQVLPNDKGLIGIQVGVNVTANLNNFRLSLEGRYGLPDIVVPNGNGTIDHYIEFPVPQISFPGEYPRITIRNSTNNLLLLEIPLSYTTDSSSGHGPVPTVDIPTLSSSTFEYTTTEEKCTSCTYEEGEPEKDSKKGEDEGCAPGQTTQEPTSDKPVNSQTNAGQSDNGQAPAEVEHSTDDLSDSDSGSPTNLNPTSTQDGQVTMSTTGGGGSYPSQITTDSGTLKVTPQTDGYDMNFYEKGDTTYTTPITSTCVRRIDAGNNLYKLRIVETRFGGTAHIESRYEQQKDGYVVNGVVKGDIWTLYEGAELAAKNSPEAPANDFLRKIVTHINDVENSQIVTISEKAATSGLWVIVSREKNFYGAEALGSKLTKTILDYGGSNRQRTWNYYPANSSNGARGGLLHYFTEHDGNRTVFGRNVTNGRLDYVLARHANSYYGTRYDLTYDGAGYDLKVVKKISGTPVSQFYVTSSSTATTETYNFQRSPSVNAQASALGSLTTSYTFFKDSDTSSATEAQSLQLKEIAYPDGTSRTYDYSESSGKVTITAEELDANDDVWTVTETDYDSGIKASVREYTHDIDGTRAASKVLIRETTRTNPDGLGRPLTRTVKFPTSPGSSDQISTRIIGCCGLKQTTDERGLVTTYHFDHLRRLETRARSGVVDLTLYNGLELVRGTIPAASAPTNSHGYYTSRGTMPPEFLGSSSQTRNLLGNLTSSKSPSSKVGQAWESFTHSTTYNSSYVRTGVLRPDGAERYTHRYLDGKLKQTGLLLTASAKTYSYGPAIPGLTYPPGAVYAERETSYGRWNATFYNFKGQMIQSEQSGGRKQTSYYNTKGQLTITVDADGVRTLFSYDTRGNRLQSALDLNFNGNIDATIDQISQSKSYYTLDNSRYGMASETKIASVENAATLKDQGFSWASLDGLHSFSQPLNDLNLRSSSETVLGGSGNWTVTATSAAGAQTVSTTTAGDLITVVSSIAGPSPQTLSSTTYERDDYKRVDAVIDGRTGRTEYTLAASGQALSVKQLRGNGAADDITTSYQYDWQGKVVKITNDLGQETYYKYDYKGQTTAVWGAQTYARAYQYNNFGQMTRMHTFQDDSVFNATTPPTMNSAGYARTEWTYDPLSGDLIEKDDHDGKGAVYTYTTAGRLETRTWARGLRTRYYYDLAGSLTNVHYFTNGASDNGNADPLQNPGNDPLTDDLAFEYDRMQRMTEVEREGAPHASYQYHPDNFRLSEEDLNQDLPAVAAVLTHTFDSLERPWVSSIPGIGGPLSSITYEYDSANRLSKVTNQSGKSFDYLYEDFGGGLIAEVQGPAHDVRNTWMPHRNNLDVKLNVVGTALKSCFNYEVNEIGQRTSVLKKGQAFTATNTATWSYNTRGELETETNSADASKNRGYTYDGIGNRLTGSQPNATGSGAQTASYLPDLLNQYDTITVGANTVSPVHDLDGNATQYPLPVNATANSTLEWDGENRLIKATLPGGTIIEYEYDYQSRRIRKSVSGSGSPGTDECYIYNGWNLMVEKRAPSGGSFTEMRVYTWGIDLSGGLQGAGGVGGLLAIQKLTGFTNPTWTSEDYYPTYDGNGNVSEYLNSSGTIVAHFEYDPFGNVTVDTDTNGLFDLRFSTKKRDAATGLYYYGYRYYDPVTGRWPSRDPLGDEFFFLTYVADYIEEFGGSKAHLKIASLRDETYGCLYGFINNSSIDGYDLLGLDRQLNGGLHLNAQIDNWKNVNGKWVKDGSTNWGYGRKVTGDESTAGHILKAVCSCVYQPGMVWGEDDDEPVKEKPPLTVVKTTPCDDIRAREKAEKLEKDPPGYNVLTSNCRTFARSMMAEGRDGAGGKKQGPCMNPDGTPWER